MSGYQHLEKYKGSLYGNLNYQGIEYDFEVPDNVVVASPGGVSGIHHHYTKGIYSDASSTRDIYAGEGDGYPYGEYGNMYQIGQSATRYMGDFVEPPDMSPSRGTGYTQNSGTPQRENFGPLPDPRSAGGIELVPSPPPSGGNRNGSPVGGGTIGGTVIHDDPDSDPTTAHGRANLINVLKLLAVFTAGYMAANFWVKAGDDYITQRFYGGEITMGWKQYAIIAAVLTAAIVAFSYFFGIPVGTLEKI